MHDGGRVQGRAAVQHDVDGRRVDALADGQRVAVLHLAAGRSKPDEQKKEWGSSALLLRMGVHGLWRNTLSRRLPKHAVQMHSTDSKQSD